jgi:hypothetical protein
MSAMDILLFDSGCTSCAAVASGIEQLGVGNRLLLRSLRDPQMQTMLTEVRPDGDGSQHFSSLTRTVIRPVLGLESP